MSGDLSPSKMRMKLMQDFEAFKQIPFPDPPDSDVLNDLWTELVEFDGHVAGLVSSFLRGSMVDPNFLATDRKLGLRLNNYVAQSEQEEMQLAKCQAYKAQLDSLVDCLRNSLLG